MENYLIVNYMNFSKEEYKARLKKVQSSMQEKGIELLISARSSQYELFNRL